ncbi:CHAT domain-containing protein [Acidobacteriota bacterium]
MCKSISKAFIATLSITVLLFQFYLYPKSIHTIESPPSKDQNFNQAKIIQQSGDFKKSLELYNKALEIAQKKQDKQSECDCLLSIGLLYWNMGQLNESTEVYEAALKLANKLNLIIQKKEAEYALEIYSHYTKAKELRNKSEMVMAINEFQTAIEKAKEIRSDEHELKCTRQLSITYWDMNNLQKFYVFSKRALEIAEKINHKREIGNNSNNLGLYFWKITEFSKALNYYQKALEIAKDLENYYEESSCLNNMGIIYKSIGNYDKALDVLNEALKLDRKLGNQGQISRALNNIGIIYRLKFMLSNETDDFELAITNFNASLTLSKKKADTETEIKILNNIGSLYSDAKRYHEALNFFDDAYLKANQNKDREAIGMVLNNIGIVYYNQGNYDESTQYFQRSIDLASKIFGGQILWEAYLELANTYKEQNKYQLALENYKASITNIENIRSNIQLEEHKASYLGTDKRITAYKNLIDLLVLMHGKNSENGYAQEAFSYMEQAKARAFLDSLEMSKIDVTHHIDFKLINQEKELQKNITKIYNTLIDAGASAEDKSVLENQLKKYEDELEALKIEIRAKYSAYAELNFPKAITLQEAQNLLDNKTAFFSYSIGSITSHAFVITRNDIELFQIPKRKELHEMVSDYLKVITDRENQDFRLGYELFTNLVEPGLKEEIKNIIFIPGDILSFLPFETLVTQENTKNWLIQKHRIAYAPSISSLNELIKRKKANGTKRRKELLAFGDPFFGSLEAEENGDDILQDFFSTSTYNLYRLEYSNTEIEKISAHFKKKKRATFQRLDASEEQLKSQALDDYKIIHFATHSLVDNKNPARSSIVLSLDNDKREDGFLQMREIYNLKLNSDLVTLSACQTGLGQFIRGEGIEGINRAFFYAGSSSVLMSLWAVNDQATYQLMERFYTHLRASESIMNSLRKAKLEMISSDILSHPYYWAGFIVSGKADQIIFPKSKLKYILAGASIIFICGIFVVVLKRKTNHVNPAK